MKKCFHWILSLMIVVSMTLQGGSVLHAEESYIDLASDALITVSSTNGDKTKDLMVDGDETTQWEATSSTKQSVTFDLQKNQELNKIAITWGADFGFKYKVQTSSDNKTYQDQIYHEEGTGALEEWEFTEGLSARYVRIYIEEAKVASVVVNIKDVKILQVKQPDVEEGVNLALHKPAYASGVELDLERLGPKGAFDGNLDDLTNGRWSSGDLKKSPQWIYVDLEEEKSFSSINILWETAHGTNFELQYSNTAADDDWTSIVKVDNGDGGWDKFTFEPVSARYVRLYITAGTRMGSKNAVSVFEMQVFEQQSGSLKTLDDIAKEFAIPAIQPEDTKMPSMTYENGAFIGEIFCSDTDIVVEDNGTIHTPMVDKKVLVTYTLKDTKTNEEKEMRNIEVIIPGEHDVDESLNEAPVSVPSLQEWLGGTGTFQLTKETVIVYQNEELKQAAEIMREDIKELFGLDVSIATTSTHQGNIILTYEQADPLLADQGYLMEIGDDIVLTGNTYRSVFFATRSVLQGLVASGETLAINKGIARDYPKYEHRKFMLDVARKYMPMWYMEDFVKYASWFKFNDFQVHLNDTSYNGHSRFRLESDIEGLTATDGFYTKEEYRNFQDYADTYGITIISEFDTPAHSGVFIDLFPELGFDPNHLDIRLTSDKKEQVYQFIEELYEEYLGGDDPVFTTEYFNVGLDEYNANYKEDMTQFTKFAMELAHDKYGKTPMAWASMGCLDTSITTLPDYPIMDAWANYAINLKSLFNQGYALINATNKYGYIVPGGNNGYPDYAKTEEIYNNFSAGKFRDKMNAGVDVAEGHPQIVGGSVSLWNDRGIFSGTSTYDVFKRQQSIIPVYAQKFWYGDDESKDYMTFAEDVESVGSGAGNHLTGEIASKSDKVYDIDFENVKQNGDILEIQDSSANQFMLTANQAQLINGEDGKALEFNGASSLRFPHTALSYPYTVAMDLKIDEYNDQEIVLFEETMPEVACASLIDSKDQVRKIFIDQGTHKLRYQRDHYNFTFDYEIPEGEWIKLALTCNATMTKLYINGQLVASLSGPLLTNSGSRWQDSATIYLPLQSVGKGLTGAIDNLKIYNREAAADEIGGIQDIAIIENLALNKPAFASSQYNASQGPEKAFDGMEDMSHRWASARTHDQWIYVDLQDTYCVNKIYMNWEDAFGAEYSLQGSLDGEIWFDIKEITETTKGVHIYDDLGRVATRYVRMKGSKAANNAKYGYSLIEMMVFEKANDELLRLIDKLEEQLAQLNVGDQPGQIDQNVYDAYVEKLQNRKVLAEAEATISDEDLINFKTELQKGYRSVEKAIVNIDESKLQAAINDAEDLESSEYTVTSWTAFHQVVMDAKGMIGTSAAQAEIDAMTKSLKDAKEMLEFRASASSIASLKHAIETLLEVKDIYTEIEFKDAQTAIDEANEVMAKAAEDISMNEVKGAVLSLAEAKAGLQHNDQLDSLKIINKEAKTILASDEIKDVRPNKVKTLQNAVDAADSLIQANSNDAAAILSAQMDLYQAIQELYKIVDKSNLEDLIASARTLSQANYTPASWEVLTSAIDEATTIVYNDDATTTEVTEANDHLLEAIANLKLNVNKDALANQIEIATKMLEKKDHYVPSTIKGLEAALAKAQAVYDDKDATNTQVKTVCDELISVMVRARLKADKTGLEIAVAEVQKMNLSLYTPETRANLQEALEIANQVLANENATTEEVKVAMEAVELAKQSLQLIDQQIIEPSNNNTVDHGNQVDQSIKGANTSDTTAIVPLVFAALLSGCVLILLDRKRKHGGTI